MILLMAQWCYFGQGATKSFYGWCNEVILSLVQRSRSRYKGNEAIIHETTKLSWVWCNEAILGMVQQSHAGYGATKSSWMTKSSWVWCNEAILGMVQLGHPGMVQRGHSGYVAMKSPWVEYIKTILGEGLQCHPRYVQTKPSL